MENNSEAKWKDGYTTKDKKRHIKEICIIKFLNFSIFVYSCK